MWEGRPAAKASIRSYLPCHWSHSTITVTVSGTRMLQSYTHGNDFPGTLGRGMVPCDLLITLTLKRYLVCQNLRFSDSNSLFLNSDSILLLPRLECRILSACRNSSSASTSTKPAKMYLLALLLPMFAVLHLVTPTPISTTTSSAATCGAPNDSICAQFLFANGTVSQDIHNGDSGCTDVAHSDIVSGIKVFDCWCGLWK
jgi:hypothetical protein